MNTSTASPGRMSTIWQKLRSRRSLIGLMLVVIGIPSLVVEAVDHFGQGGATVTEQAERTRPPINDLVSIYNSGALRSSTESQAIAAAQRAGANYTVRGSASIAMQRIRRNGVNVQVAPSGMSIPMGTTVLDKSAIATLMGFHVAGPMNANSIVMSQLTASLRGAQAGDIITLRSSGGTYVDFTIGAIVDDATTGGTELLMTHEAAARINLNRRKGIVIWGFESRAAIDSAMAAEGLVSTSIRIRRSWDPRDPDSTIGMARTKQLLGEFAYQAGSSQWVTIDSAWTSANLPSGRRNIGIGIRARCHNVIEPALRAAFAEIAARGLHGVFDVDHANIAGGCFAPRFNRLTPNSTIGFLSRHAWGMAIDTNTVTACQGCAPPSFVYRSGGCTAVQIMRKHGFAWGGNFLTPDGMHFEWVGERRDQLPYPSRYCPNVGSALQMGELQADYTERATIFADAGLVAEAS